jgi:hypothetical protein
MYHTVFFGHALMYVLSHVRACMCACMCACRLKELGHSRHQQLHALEFALCLAILAFIFLSDLVAPASLLMFPIQGWVALRFSQVGLS